MTMHGCPCDGCNYEQEGPGTCPNHGEELVPTNEDINTKPEESEDDENVLQY